MYKEYNDYELLYYINENDEDANNILFNKYTPVIKNIISKKLSYAEKNGLDYNDLMQEGLIGLNSAINSFKEEKNVMFYTFANVCIERSINNAIRNASRDKHKNLNNSISLDYIKEESNDSLYNEIVNTKDEVLDNILVNEYKSDIYKFVEINCSKLEQEIFNLKIQGYKIKEICEITNKSSKTIDNAVQRLKIKIKNNIKNDVDTY